MDHFPSLCCLVSVSCLVAATAVAQGTRAHVHGVASLQVAVDGNTLTLIVESPLDSLLGFEHVPRTETERTAVRGMAERLNKAETLFVPTPAAHCKPVSVKLESPVLQPPKTARGDSHADLDGEFVFRCERPETLRDIEVTMFDGFANLRQIDVQVATSSGQAASKLSRKQRRIAW